MIKKRLMILTALVALLMVSDCKRQARVTAPPESPAMQTTEPRTTEPKTGELEKDEMTIEGILKPTVERGGWILETGSGQYLLLRVREFSDKPWFQVGARLKARGKVDRDVITTFMQGTPFMVSQIEPVEEPGRDSFGQGLRRR